MPGATVLVAMPVDISNIFRQKLLTAPLVGQHDDESHDMGRTLTLQPLQPPYIEQPLQPLQPLQSPQKPSCAILDTTILSLVQMARRHLCGTGVKQRKAGMKSRTGNTTLPRVRCRSAVKHQQRAKCNVIGLPYLPSMWQQVWQKVKTKKKSRSKSSLTVVKSQIEIVPLGESSKETVDKEEEKSENDDGDSPPPSTR